MPQMKYNYDDSGNIYYYFLFIIYGFFLFAYSVYCFFKFSKYKRLLLNYHQNKCLCQECSTKNAQIISSFPSLWSYKDVYVLSLGWIVFSFISYTVWSSRHSFSAGYDPYEVLQISPNSTPEQIKLQFKKLSILYHPDRTEEIEKEKATQYYIEFSKAYKILTDSDAKKLFDETGNPDGNKHYDLGIALPSYLVEKTGWVLLFYGVLFGVLVPLFVFNWWKKSKTYTRNNINYNSMSLFFQEIKESMSISQLIQILCASVEFQQNFKWKPQDTKIIPGLYQKIKNIIETKSGQKFEKNKNFTAPYWTKCFTLLMCHLYRIPIEDPSLEKEQEGLIQTALHLTNGILQILLARDWTATSFSAIILQRMIIHAIYDPSFSLLQLSGLTEDLLNDLKKKKSSVKSTHDLIDMEDSKRRALLQDLPESLYNDLVLVGRKVPRLVMIKSLFKCNNRKEITTNSVVTGLFYFAIAFSSEEESFAKSIEVEANESLFGKYDMKSYREKVSRHKTGAVALTHSPHYFGIEKQPGWWVYLYLSRPSFQSLIQTQKLNYIPLVSEFMNRDKKMQEPGLLLNFPTSTNVCTMSLNLDLKCDSWFDSDLHYEFQIQVSKPSSETSSEETFNEDIYNLDY